MNIKYLFFIALMITCAGCTDILDKKDLSAVTEEDVWNDPLYATAYLNKLYRDNLPGWDNMSQYSDESNGGDAIMYGQLTTNSIDSWPYGQIRNINLLIQKVTTGKISKDDQEKLKAQAVILRAWRYFEMVRLYGGVPMLLEPQKQIDDLYVTRNKTSECVDLIVKDLDYAISILPWKWSGADEGRFTKATAMALKGRVLLYFASPQFNPNNDKARWEKAYAANKLAKEELEKNGYGLFEKYENIWFNEMNKEVIMVRRYQEPDLTHSWDALTRPLSEAQNFNGGNQPSLEMVRSYPMNTGVSIKESAEYDSVLFWKNRDPRFKSTIAFNSCIWELSNKKGRRQWTYSGSEPYNPTATGFYCRKAINVTYTPYYTERSSTDWVEIRFAEVLLNFAECAAELNKSDEAYAVIKQIRQRAEIIPGVKGMYGLKEGMSHNELINAVMLERKIEFAYEGKRYWDLRRRRLFESELNGNKRHGVMPKLRISQADFDKVKDKVDYDKDYAVYFKDSTIVLDKKFDIDFKSNYYFYAIPNKHLETNSNLKQTKGWDNGDFDPYQ